MHMQNIPIENIEEVTSLELTNDNYRQTNKTRY